MGEEHDCEFDLPSNLIKILRLKRRRLCFSERTRNHIINKHVVHEYLISNIQNTLNNYNEIFISDKKSPKDHTKRRFILVSEISTKYVGVVIEVNGTNSLVTAMMVDIKYTRRKFKKLIQLD